MNGEAISESEERMLLAIMILVRTRQELERLLVAPGGDVTGSVKLARAIDLVRLGSAVVCAEEVGT